MPRVTQLILCQATLSAVGSMDSHLGYSNSLDIAPEEHRIYQALGDDGQS